MMIAPAPMTVHRTGKPHAEDTNRLKPYSTLALMKSWMMTVLQEKVWRVASLKRAERYSITVLMRLRRQRVAKRKYPSRKLSELPTYRPTTAMPARRSEEHTYELQSRGHLVCRSML